MNMDASGLDWLSGEALEIQLRHALYRVDCPDAHTLGEFELDLLDPVERIRVAGHAVDCEACAAELGVLRTYLATPTTVAEPLTGRARRIVAALFAPRPELAYGGLRGVGDSATHVYTAGEVTVTLGPGLNAGSVLGLVVADDVPPETLLARAVRLVPRAGSSTAAQLDDLGNFEFDDVPTGVYDLELDLPGSLVVIEDFRVD
jgi:hypothetical protein